MPSVEDFLYLLGRHKKLLSYLFQNRSREVLIDEALEFCDERILNKLRKSSVIAISGEVIELEYLIAQFLESFFTGIGYSGIDSIATNLEEIENILDKIKSVANEEKEIRKLRTLISRVFIDIKEYLKRINYEISEVYKSADTFELKKEQLLKSKSDLDKVAETVDTLRVFLNNNKARILMLSSGFLHLTIKEMEEEIDEMPIKIRYSNGELYRWINDMETRIQKNEKILVLARLVEDHKIEIFSDQISLDIMEKTMQIRGCFPQEEMLSEKFISTYEKIGRVGKKIDKIIEIEDFPTTETLFIPEPEKLQEKFFALSDNITLIDFLSKELENDEQILEMFCEMISLFSDQYLIFNEKEDFKNWEVSKILKKEEL